MGTENVKFPPITNFCQNSTTTVIYIHVSLSNKHIICVAGYELISKQPLNPYI